MRACQKLAQQHQSREEASRHARAFGPQAVGDQHMIIEQVSAQNGGRNRDRDCRQQTQVLSCIIPDMSESHRPLRRCRAS